jgi:hypothetical protein
VDIEIEGEEGFENQGKQQHKSPRDKPEMEREWGSWSRQ